MKEDTQQSLEIILSPQGHLYLDGSSGNAWDFLRSYFSKNPALGLIHLGIRDFGASLATSFSFWQGFARQLITQVCRKSHSTDRTAPIIEAPNQSELDMLLNQAFIIRGFEYLTPDLLLSLWKDMADALRQEIHDFSGTVQDYLKQFNPNWNLVGRVCFHLAENKNDPTRPFAFLATYTSQLSQGAKAQHLPLKRALQDYAGELNREILLALLLPVQKASNASVFLDGMVKSGAIFQAQSWTAHEAYQFLRDIPLMESSGIMVRVPNWWNSQKPPRPKVSVRVGQQKSLLGLNTLLDFDMSIVLDNGDTITREELQQLLNSSEGLVKIKGQWVEIDRTRLQSVLKHWHEVQEAAKEGISVAEGLRLLAGGNLKGLEDQSADNMSAIDWSSVVAGDWLKLLLQKLRDPAAEEHGEVDALLNKHLKASLRPYQIVGVKWLWLLYQLRLGSCLADDMGLGKTIQVLSLLLLAKYHAPASNAQKKPHLLVVPASLIGNWQAEAAKFSPNLTMLIAHGSANHRSQDLQGIDLVVTTYGYLHRTEWINKTEWDLAILDEAQLIKNPGAKQTKAVKDLKSQVRLILTGTPVENQLNDFWSLFDYISPGLLGTNKDFANYAKRAAKDPVSEQQRFLTTLRSLTQPYILRRLKSDKRIIADLPDKMEMLAYCTLSQEQISLYQQAVNELGQKLEQVDAIQRRGIVLSYLMRLKQICNHPNQWLGYREYSDEASGKFQRLQEICQEIASKQEKVLVFTQYREIIPALSALLERVFGKPGLCLDGSTNVNKRTQMVASFQEEQGPPFFVLSLKAGGTGLNLTKASHVIHFDRWWNPAVENQATDRAYRIGQQKTVLVHKFVCRGTIEDKIDELISSKQKLAQDLLEGSSELALTELSNEQLLQMISLDLKKVMSDV